MTTNSEPRGVSPANASSNNSNLSGNTAPAVSQKKDIANGSISDSVTGNNKLTIERANSIGWFFIESYYELYNKDIESLYKLYNSDASISHGDISELSKSLRQGNGTDSIKALFKDVNSSEIKNKIIIVNADIQICMNNSILIVVTGEWSKNSSPYYQFNQTFVLCRGINESTFDIANDILRFIDYEFKHDTLADKKDIKKTADAEPQEKPQQSEEPSIQEQAEIKENGNGDKQESEQTKASADAEAPAETNIVEEETPKKVDEDKEGGKEEKSSKETKASAESEKEAGSQSEKESNGSNGGGPISWAALAATAKDKSPSHTNAKPSPTAAKSQPKKTTTTPTQSQVTPLPNGKYKKEDWFPIYIRNCEELTEKALKEHLTKEFGEIKFLRQNLSIALCDFLDSEGQRKALDAKKTVIDGVEISLEVRESKAGRKDFKSTKANDPKRKLDKKQQPAKKK